jgi:ATP-dependent helicase/nuclease subunit A
VAGARVARAADAASPERGRRHVALQENFRSQPALIEVMNGIFESILTPEVAGVDYTRGHALRAGKGEAPGRGAQGSDRTTLNGVPVEVHLVAPDADVTNDDNDEEEENGRENRSHEDENEEDLPTAAEMEARVVAQRIEQFIADGKTLRQKDGTLRKLEYRDIAVLVRSARTRGMIFARALSDRGIPVHADLASGFFDTPEVQHAMALLQVLDNPRQDIPLAAALLGPFGGFAHDDLAIVRLTFDRKEVSFAEAAQAYVSCDSRTRAQVAAAAGPVRYLLNDAPVFSEDLARRLTQFFAKLARWREMLHGRPLHEGLAEIFAESGIYTWLAALDTGPQRIANLQMLHQRALAFAGFKKQGLHRFLRFIERLRIQEEADGGEAPILSEASNVVRIMTIHKSKGLEFPVVFVSGLGSLLRLSDEGPVLLHRDLGVGLNMVDLDRNIHYPSASSLRIRDAKKRAARAEELRLLYVAITRARDMLVLTGHVRKADEVANWRKVWNTRSGPVPEDVLLKGRRAIDWVMPALVLASRRRNGALSVAWPGDSDNAAQALIALHRVTTTPVGRQATLSPDAQAVLAAQPLGGDTAGLESLIARVAGNYQFAAQAARPAVQTVSFLKTLAGQREVDEPEPAGMFDDPALDAEPASDAAVRETQIEAARLRGLATHRVLELLDLAHCASEAQLNEQVASLIAAKQLTDAERDRADWRGIKWFLWHSQSGARVLHAARAAAGGSTILRREIPFAWIGTIDPRPDIAEDIPTIRGVIDVLLVDRPQSRAEIIDYKTDSARLWQSRVNDYRRQMRYYMAAAGDILGMKVPRATLVFLAAKVEIVVEQEI